MVQNPTEVEEEDTTPHFILRNCHMQQPELKQFTQLLTKKTLNSDKTFSRARGSIGQATAATRITQGSPPLQLDWNESADGMP